MANFPLPVAIVTGSSSGIGTKTAIRLSKMGFKVWLHYNSNQKGAESLQKHLVDEGAQALIWGANLSQSEKIDEQLEEIWKSENSPQIGVLVNNAGLHEDNLAGLMSFESFDRVVKTNLYGPFMLMKWASRKMMRHRKGCIVNVSSLAGQMGNPGQINYAASKAGLIAMTKTLAMELGPRNIRVNAVAPGFIETEMIQNVPQLETYKSRIPLGRFGTADEVASAIAFLCSDESTYITGHTISINGGLYPT